MVITNKSQTQAQTKDGVLCSISISGMVIIKILRLFSNLEIGLYLAQELSSNVIFITFFLSIIIFGIFISIVQNKPSFT